jgi:hypothetical protein
MTEIDTVAIEVRARAMRAAFIRGAVANLVARLRGAPLPARA